MKGAQQKIASQTMRRTGLLSISIKTATNEERLKYEVKLQTRQKGRMDGGRRRRGTQADRGGRSRGNLNDISTHTHTHTQTQHL